MDKAINPTDVLYIDELLRKQTIIKLDRFDH